MKCPYDGSDLALEARFEQVDSREMIEVALTCNECSYENWTYLQPIMSDKTLNWAFANRQGKLIE